jgi:hypothetical protein
LEQPKNVIKVQKIPKKDDVSFEELLMTFCYKYPQYKYNEAKNMPYKRVLGMLKVAEKQDAIMMYTLTRAIVAPHTKKGVGVKSLTDDLRKVING